MKVIAMIPARFAAERFPGKLLADLAGKPVVIRTFEAVQNTGLFDEVYVVTDREEIQKKIIEFGGKALMSTQEYACGSDRIAAAVQDLEADIVINVQGDEPFVQKNLLEALIRVFKNDPSGAIDVASLVHPMHDWDEIENPNNVKVVMDAQNCVLYFSRAPIPYPRDHSQEICYHKHIGIYAFRKNALEAFAKMPMRQNELAEKLEGIRFLEHGKKIKMVVTEDSVIGIDTPEDLERANELWT